MDAERLLISKAAHTGQVEKLIADGVRSDQFLDPELQDIWNAMVDHIRRYKAAPSLKVLRESFPNFNFEVVTDALEYIRDKHFAQAKRREAIKVLEGLAECVEDPHRVTDIESHFLEASRSLAQLVPGSRVHRFSEMGQRIAAYDAALKDGVSRGIMMGIPTLDALTMGIQPHEYVTVSGWSGTGKSTLTQWMLFNAYAQGKTPMLISLEMECEALFRKWDTMYNAFSYHALKSMELHPEDRKKWEEAAERVAKAPNDIIALDDIRGCTVDKVYGETVRYGPDLVAVDYVSLMEAPGGKNASMWEKITMITRGLKQNARTLKVPIVAVAQTNRESAEAGAELSNIAYSVSIIQDSDIVLGLFQNDKMRENKQMQVRLQKNRDGAIRYQECFWDMDRMSFREWNDAMDIFNRPAEAAGV